MDERCPACHSLRVWTVRVPLLQFHLCRDCLHAVTPPALSAGGVEAYYADKPKWRRLLEQHQRDGAIPDAPMRYGERKTFVLQALQLAGRDPAQCSLLDVGTAAGFFLGELGGAVRSKLGTDIDRAAVRYAREVLGQPVVCGGLDAAEVRRAAPFDAVTCFHVLEHVPDPAALLSTLAELAAPGGIVVLAMPLIEPERRPNVNFYREFPPPVAQLDLETEHIHHFSRHSAAALASRCGLRILRRHVWDYKAGGYLREILLCLQSGGPTAAPAPRVSLWRAWAARRQLVRWALRSRRDQLRRRAA